MKKVKYRECPTLEVLDPVCQRSVYPPIDDYVREATEIALCGVKPSKTRERSHEWLEVTRGQTYRLPGVRINNWFEEGQDIAHLRREHSILSDVRCYKYYGQSSSSSSSFARNTLPGVQANSYLWRYFHLSLFKKSKYNIVPQPFILTARFFLLRCYSNVFIPLSDRPVRCVSL